MQVSFAYVVVSVSTYAYFFYVHKHADTVSVGGGFGGLPFWVSGFVPTETNMYSCGQTHACRCV